MFLYFNLFSHLFYFYLPKRACNCYFHFPTWVKMLSFSVWPKPFGYKISGFLCYLYFHTLFYSDIKYRASSIHHHLVGGQGPGKSELQHECLDPPATAMWLDVAEGTRANQGFLLGIPDPHLPLLGWGRVPGLSKPEVRDFLCPKRPCWRRISVGSVHAQGHGTTQCCHIGGNNQGNLEQSRLAWVSGSLSHVAVPEGTHASSGFLMGIQLPIHHC